jgi:3-deoxy-D-manno-octulosonate 8-phosphate phosphatase (KDO 8-P phosphatase)
MVTRLEPAELRRRARAIRLVLSDVDGVLTDAGVYYSAIGEEFKRFSLRDGMGVELLRGAGIQTGLVSRERSPIVLSRARKLELRHVFLGVHDKLAALDGILAQADVPLDAVAYIGDDVNDLGVLERIATVGLTAVPADAMSDVKAIAHLVTEARGGEGAFREFADSIRQWRHMEDRG